MLRVRNHCGGTIGAATRRSTCTKAYNNTTPSAIAPTMRGEFQPQVPPRLMPSNNNVAPPPSVRAPAASKRAPGWRSVSRNNHHDTTAPRMHSGACTKKMMRQPTKSTSGTPATTPMTGAPAVTKLHMPSGRTRSCGSYMRFVNAIADGPVAEPHAAERVRNKINIGALGAKAVRPAKIPAPSRPPTNTRLCPIKSPSLPKAGPITAKANIGAVIDQLTTLTVDFKSAATVSNTTTSKVTVKLTVNTPLKSTVIVALRREIPMRSTNAERTRSCRGASATSSTPAVIAAPSRKTSSREDQIYSTALGHDAASCQSHTVLIH